MSTIGVIGAMEEEVAEIKEQMELITAKRIVGVEFMMGKLEGNNVVLVRSGIGKVNAAICAQVLIDLYGVDYIINTGVAGALDKSLEIGDIVISTDVVQHDMDVTAFGTPPGVIPRMENSFFAADDTLSRLAESAGRELEPKVKTVKGRIASGDQFIADNAAKQRITSLFKPLCVEMEGAAIAQTAWLNMVPFVVVRAISDKADGDAKVSFNRFVADAARNSAAIVRSIAAKL